MKKIIINETSKKITLDMIEEFENHIDHQFPNDYRKFLLENNGGYPLASDFNLIAPIEEVITEARVDRFLSLYGSEQSNLNNYYKIYKDRIPKKFISIANDPGGNLICICLAEEKYGKIYFWDHDWEADEGEQPSYDNVYLIANSFTDFINRLYEFELEEDENGNDIEISIHDQYSLPSSHYITTYGNVITDFFNKAPKEVEKFIIKEFDSNGDLLLLFKSNGKEHSRHINKKGQIIN